MSPALSQVLSPVLLHSVLNEPGHSPTTGGGGGPFRVTDSILGAGGLDYDLYDSSALDRMWQESTGQTAAVLASPVGLIVGREKQAAKTFAQVMAGQPELVTNGDFSSPAGWSVTGGWAVTGGQAVAPSTSAFTAIQQPFPFVAGRMYAVTYDVVEASVGGARFVFFAGGTQVSGVSRSTAGRYTEFAVANAGNTQFGIQSNGSGFTGKIDNITVKEIPAHYASQASAGARPVLQSDGLKFDGSDDNLLTDWLAQAGANCIIAQVTVPATLPGTQVIVGANDAVPNRFRLEVNASGNVAGSVGAAFPSLTSLDVRGQSVIVALSFDGTTINLFAENATTSLAQGANAPNTTVRPNIGALNSNGSPSNFFAGTVKRVALSKVAVTQAQFQQIRAEWLAAA